MRLTEPNTDAGRSLRAALTLGAVAERTDAELLARFRAGVATRDDAAEAAFAALVERHAAGVVAVARRILGDEAAALDAAQATFLVLARRAGAIRVGASASLGPWLGATARRIARGARRAEGRRRHHELRAAQGRPESVDHRADPATREAVGIVLDELARLPEPFRRAVAACHLDGLTQHDAAQALGWPIGTLQSRLARGRERLRDRLARRGLTSLSLPTLLPRRVPDAWVLATSRAAIGGVGGAGPGSLALLAPGAVALLPTAATTTTKGLLMTKATLGTLLLGATLTIVGTSWAPGSGPSDGQPGSATHSAPAAPAPAPVDRVDRDQPMIDPAGPIIGRVVDGPTAGTIPLTSEAIPPPGQEVIPSPGPPPAPSLSPVPDQEVIPGPAQAPASPPPPTPTPTPTPTPASPPEGIPAPGLPSNPAVDSVPTSVPVPPPGDLPPPGTVVAPGEVPPPGTLMPVPAPGEAPPTPPVAPDSPPVVAESGPNGEPLNGPHPVDGSDLPTSLPRPATATIARPVDGPDLPTLLCFRANWSAACQQVDSAVDLMIARGYPIRRVDIERSPDLKARYEIRGIPAFVLIDGNGHELARTMGARPAGELAEFFNANRPRTTRTTGATAASAAEPTLKLPAPIPRPWETVARIRVIAPSKKPMGVYSGVVVASDASGTKILTTDRLWSAPADNKEMILRNGRFLGEISVDLFDGSHFDGSRVPVATVNHVGTLLESDPASNLLLMAIKPGVVLPVAPVVPPDWAAPLGTDLVTVGCSNGNDPTAWSTTILQESVGLRTATPTGYSGIMCAHVPRVGRFGGGLFTPEGQLVGISNFAMPTENAGLYAGTDAVRKFLLRCKIGPTRSGPTRTVAEVGTREPFRFEPTPTAAVSPPVEVPLNPGRGIIAQPVESPPVPGAPTAMPVPRATFRPAPEPLDEPMLTPIPGPASPPVPGRSATDQRLDDLERKLDRLLERLDNGRNDRLPLPGLAPAPVNPT